MGNKQITPPTEEEKESIKEFLDNGNFEIKGKNYLYFGVKRGYLKDLKVYYSVEEIKVLLDRIEELLNYGAMCSECLRFCKFISEYENNAYYFECVNCGVIC